MMDNLLLIPALLVVNMMTYFLYAWDKRQAIHDDWRVPESALLLMGFIGGSPAALFAQRHLRHKNRKTAFQVKFWLLVVVQVFIILRLV